MIAFSATETIVGAHALHPSYPILPRDVLVERDGQFNKIAPGIALMGFRLTDEQRQTLKPIQMAIGASPLEVCTDDIDEDTPAGILARAALSVAGDTDALLDSAQVSDHLESLSQSASNDESRKALVEAAGRYLSKYRTPRSAPAVRDWLVKQAEKKLGAKV